MSWIPTPSISNPYTYIDTLRELHSDIWAGAVNIVNQLNGSSNGSSAEERRNNAVTFLRTIAT